MTKDIEREAFERFIFGDDYESLKANYDEYEKEHGFRYPPFTYDREWESWQAAKAHETEKLKGCVVVPVEPTEAMIEAGNDANECGSWPHEIYAAMLEAARGGNE